MSEESQSAHASRAPRGDLPAAISFYAREAPDRVALNYPIGARGEGWQSLTYAELDARVERLAQHYRALGLKPGDTVLLMFPPSLQFYPVVFGLLRAGLVPIFIDPAMGIKKALNCVKTIKPRAMIAPLVVHIISLFLRPTIPSIKIP